MLSWLMQNKNEPFAKEFMDKLVGDNFTSVKEAQEAALALFKVQNPDNYHYKQVTVASQEIKGKKRRLHLSSNRSSDECPLFTKKQFIQMAKDVFIKPETIHLVETHVSKNLLQHHSSKPSNINLVREAYREEITTSTMKTISLFCDILDSINHQKNT